MPPPTLNSEGPVSGVHATILVICSTQPGVQLKWFSSVEC